MKSQVIEIALLFLASDLFYLLFWFDLGVILVLFVPVVFIVAAAVAYSTYRWATQNSRTD